MFIKHAGERDEPVQKTTGSAAAAAAVTVTDMIWVFEQ